MFVISIDQYTLIGIFIIALLILIIATYMFIAYIVHDKRKFNSIDKYNEFTMDKPKTYNDIRKDYDTNVKKSGVAIDKKSRMKTFYRIIKFFKRDSK